jgi:hypothetical protein
MSLRRWGQAESNSRQVSKDKACAQEISWALTVTMPARRPFRHRGRWVGFGLPLRCRKPGTRGGSRAWSCQPFQRFAGRNGHAPTRGGLSDASFWFEVRKKTAASELWLSFGLPVLRWQPRLGTFRRDRRTATMGHEAEERQVQAEHCPQPLRTRQRRHNRRR